jgi:autotransporter-associated beta strand protein
MRHQQGSNPIDSGGRNDHPESNAKWAKARDCRSGICVGSKRQWSSNRFTTPGVTVAWQGVVVKYRKWALAIAAGLGTLRSVPSFGQLAAFPGAQGFGGNATGGRGGSIYVVTNNNSSGTGSFEDAVSQPNRIIVFAIGGYVNMPAAISCASNLTILGQTAPGQGIAFEGAEISFNNASNDIVQYIRAREGSNDPNEKASINLGGTSNMILDHIDAEFSQYDNIDAVGSPTTTNNITLQNSLIADPIKAQQFNMHTEGNNTTYLNNIFANGEGRSVLAKSNSQFVNNVIYNYGYAYTTGSSSGVFTYDILNNNFIAGPSTNNTADAFYQLDNNQSAYSSGNVVDGNKNGVLDGTVTSATSGSQDTMNALTAEWSSSTQFLPTLGTSASYNFDIAHAGALYSNGNGTFSRDQVDSQIVSQVQSLGTSGSILNQQGDDGLSNDGFGTLVSANNSTGTLDTVPFAWLMSHGLSTTSAAQLVLPNALGYDMIEEYAQQVGDQYASQTATSGDWATTTWSSTTPGIYDHALIRGTGTANGSVTIGSLDVDSAFTVSIGGNGPMAGESLVMTGGSLVVQDTIYVGDQNNGSLTMTGGTIRANNVQLGNTVWNTNGSSSTTYTGILNLNGGILTTGQVVLGGGVAGSWTTGGSINWSGGTLQSIGTLYVNVPATLGVGGGTLDTNSGTATLSGVISGNGPFNIIGGGTLSLTGTNTFTGVTTISGAILSIGSLTNGGIPGEIGAATNAAANLVLDGGTLAGTGLTDHLFTLTSKGGTLDNSGGVSFTNTGAIALPLANVTLTLTGSNTGHEAFAPQLANPAGGYVLSVLKTGVGKWTFNSSNTKTYTGDTDVTAGTLETLASNALSPDSNMVISAGAILEFHGYSSSVNALEGAGIVQDSFDHASDTFTIGAFNGSGTFSGNLGNGNLPNVVKAGSGTQILTGTDTYTGATTINAGVLQFNSSASIGGTGVSVTIAAGATAAAGYAMDQTTFLGRIVNTSNGTAALAVSSANNLDFSSATGANLPNVSLGAVGTATYTGNLTPYGTIYRLGGGGGDLILPNANALSGNDSVIVSGAASTVDITGTNTYTGTTTISGGATLQVSTLANGGLPSGIGQSSNAAANLILDGGTLAGSGSTDRLFTLTANGGTLDNSAGMVFTNTGAIALPAANVTLTLTGANTGHEDLSPVLADPGNGYVTSVVKNGTGMWTFNTTGSKTYSGNTTVNAGTLETLGSNTLSPNSSILLGQNTILELHDTSQAINGLSGSGSIQNYFVAHNDTLTVGANNGSGTFSGIINSGATLNLVKTGSGTQILSGNNTYVGSTTISGGTLKLSGNAPIASYNFSSISGGTVANSGIAGTSMNAVLNGSGGTLSTSGGPISGTGMLTLNGTPSSLDVNSPITDLSSAASWTVSLWVKTTQAGAALLYKGDGTDWTTGNSTLYLGTTANGGSGAGGSPTAVRYAGGFAAGSTTVNNGGWHMLTFTDNAGAKAIYTDGVLGTTTLEAGGFDTADIGTMVRFGLTTDTFDGAASLNGSLSDINIYNTALTSAQIQSLYTTNTETGLGTNILPSATAVSLTSASATLDIESVNQTIASLSGLSGSSVILGGQSNLIVNNATSTEYDGVISGNGSLNIQGGLTLTLGGTSTYTGATNVSSGTLTVNGVLSALTTLTVNGTTNLGPNTGNGFLNRTFAVISIGTGGKVAVGNSTSHSNRSVVVTSSLSFGGTTNNWQGQLDFGFNDAIIHNGSLSNVSNQVKEGFNSGAWNGSGGIYSSTAAAASSHLTALGVIQNSVNGNTTGSALYSSFDGTSAVDTDVLIKYTYYGDANLDGKVDGSDYSRIDSGYLNHTTGWYNGDFNYDGVVNGSDYTLIDNAFNSQGAILTDLIASPDADVASQVEGVTSVPEPAAAAGFLIVTGLGLLGRRRRL